MVSMSVLGLTWCQHAGWTLSLLDVAGKRRLQLTLRLEEALVLGQELARRQTDRSGLYTLVGAILRRQPQPASVHLTWVPPGCARVALVLGSGDGEIDCITSPADGVALAARVGLPIVADEALLEAFGVPAEPELLEGAAPAEQPVEIPHAFRLALTDPPDDAA
jgi:bifunctional DNase/RNase